MQRKQRRILQFWSNFCSLIGTKNKNFSIIKKNILNQCREAELVSSLSHTNIVSIVGVTGDPTEQIVFEKVQDSISTFTNSIFVDIIIIFFIILNSYDTVYAKRIAAELFAREFRLDQSQRPDTLEPRSYIRLALPLNLKYRT